MEKEECDPPLHQSIRKLNHKLMKVMLYTTKLWEIDALGKDIDPFASPDSVNLNFYCFCELKPPRFPPKANCLV